MMNADDGGKLPSPHLLSRTVQRLSSAGVDEFTDDLAVEEPLDMQVEFGPPDWRQVKTISITMRTPGDDRELAVGFLVGEGLLRSPDEVENVWGEGTFFGPNTVRVALQPGVMLDMKRLERNCYTTSSCGVCGKTSMEALELNFSPVPETSDCEVSERVIRSLPERLREGQAVFQLTGGIHAAGLFNPDGTPIVVREDVGRHNAVDKVIGSQFLAGNTKLSRTILMVSGRASFELMQKALAAGIPMLVAVGAPSSLAVQVAEKFGATLIGFTKRTGFNIYTGPGRIRIETPSYETALARFA